MTKFTSQGQETYRLGPVERWVAGTVAGALIAGIGALIVMAIRDHDRMTIMEYRAIQIQSDIQELKATVYRHKEKP